MRRTGRPRTGRPRDDGLDSLEGWFEDQYHRVFDTLFVSKPFGMSSTTGRMKWLEKNYQEKLATELNAELESATFEYKK